MSRYTQLLGDAVQELIPEYKTRDAPSKDALDVFIEHRLTNARRHQDDQAPNTQTPVEAQFPSDLLRRFEVYWKPRSTIKSTGIRVLRADQVCFVIRNTDTYIYYHQKLFIQYFFSLYGMNNCRLENWSLYMELSSEHLRFVHFLLSQHTHATLALQKLSRTSMVPVSPLKLCVIPTFASLTVLVVDCSFKHEDPNLCVSKS